MLKIEVPELGYKYIKFVIAYGAVLFSTLLFMRITGILFEVYTKYSTVIDIALLLDGILSVIAILYLVSKLQFKED